MTNVEGASPKGRCHQTLGSTPIDHPLTGLYRAFSGEQFEGPVD